MKKVAVAVFACLWMVAQPVNAGSREEALAAYDKFFAAFTTDNQDEITKFFAPDAQFFGTNSTDVVTTLEGIHKYFSGALTGTRGATKATQFDRTALALSDNIVEIAGKWQSERTKDGKMITAGPSRSTVVMQKRGDQWLIVQFHNSPTPKPPGVAPATSSN